MSKNRGDLKNEHENKDVQKKNKEETGQKKYSGEETKKSQTTKERKEVEDENCLKKEKIYNTDTIESDYYSKILGDVVKEVYFELTANSKIVLDLMSKYALMANCNVMVSDENKVLAPCTLFRLLISLESLSKEDKVQANYITRILKDDHQKSNAFNLSSIKRAFFNYNVLNHSDRKKLFELINLYFN